MSVFLASVGVASATSVPPGPVYVGQAITATPDNSGDTVDWYQCTATGTLGAQVATDTSPPYTYTPAETDAGFYLCAEDTTAMSSAIGMTTTTVSDPDATAPSIGGTAQEGQTLSVVQNGSWTDPPTSISYQWCRVSGGVCDAISGANGATYTLQASDVGDDVEVSETPVYGSNPGNAATGATQTSDADDTVASAAPVRTSGPTITGSDRQGQTLTAAVGSWTGDPAYAFQWLRCTITCAAIPGAMGSTYALTDADVGTSLEVEVTATDAYGSVSAFSSRSGVVSATTTTRLVVSTGQAHVNESVTLTAFVYSSADTADPNGSVTFDDDGVAVPGCVGVPAAGSGQGTTVSCSASFGAPAPSLTATFTPAPGSPLAGSSSAAQSLGILADASTVALDVPNRAVRRQAVTYTVSVSPANDLTGPIVPGGTVRFLSGRDTIPGCARVALRDGGATCTTRYAATGTHRISVRYAGTADFLAASSPTRTIRILRALPRPEITATMQWTFHYTPSWTRILALELHGVPAHARVTLRCVGGGCPRRPRTRTERSAHATLDLESSFRGRRLRVHTLVVVEVTRARYVGEYYRFTILAARQPAILISCLAPGSHRPGVGCRR